MTTLRSNVFLTALAAAGLLLMGSAAPQSSSPTALEPARATQAAPVSSAPTPSSVGTSHPLTVEDVNAWLDGFMPYALKSGNIAGAVVVVVKDGQVLTEKGYGFSDVKTRTPVIPDQTLFRPGSISKLFTWTAVMQLVQEGKINLDTDVNAYLDFRIPPRFGKPITMRDLMTHTPGFEDVYQDQGVSKPAYLTSLGAYLKAHVPERIYPPGEVPAYSNYGAVLAGYIVARLSGEPFDEYIQRHIFAPLDMAHSTFAQPLPAAMRPFMSQGYIVASGPAKPYELINVRPAGSLTTTGDDMAHFMIAQLQNGRYGAASILQPATAIEMHQAQPPHNPPLPSFALGFYHEDRNGQVIIGHAGDTNFFHSDLHMLPAQGVGIFLAVNSLGTKGAAEPVREQLFHEFLDRYFPVPSRIRPAIVSAAADAKTLDGLYWSSRRNDSSFMRFLGLLGQVKVISDSKGIVTVSELTNAARAPLKWHEIAPFLWQDASGEDRLEANVKNGRVEEWASDILPPAFEFLPVPTWAQSSWNEPLFIAMIVVFLLTIIFWPVSAIVRAKFKARLSLPGSAAWAYHFVRVGAVADILGLAAYFAIFQRFVSGSAWLDPTLTPWLWLAQILCILSFPAAVLAIWNAVEAWRGEGRGWFGRLWSLVLMLSCFAMIWFVLSLHLVTLNVRY